MTETATTTLYCYVHPSRETSLRCNNCNRPICASCAVRTPTGYRCRECVKGLQKVFDTAEWYDYVLGFALAGVLSATASFLASQIGGFGFFAWFIIFAGAPAASVIIQRAFGLSRAVLAHAHFLLRSLPVLFWALD